MSKIPEIKVILSGEERRLVLLLLERTQVVGTRGMRALLSLRDKLAKNLPVDWEKEATKEVPKGTG